MCSDQLSDRQKYCSFVFHFQFVFAFHKSKQHKNKFNKYLSKLVSVPNYRILNAIKITIDSEIVVKSGSLYSTLSTAPNSQFITEIYFKIQNIDGFIIAGYSNAIC